jgi:hypothetical protein
VYISNSLTQIQSTLAPPSQQQQQRRRRNSTRRGSPATSVQRDGGGKALPILLTPPILHDDFMRHEQLLPKLHSLQQPSPGPVLTRPGPEPAVTPRFSSFPFSCSPPPFPKPCLLVSVLNI